MVAGLQLSPQYYCLRVPPGPRQTVEMRPVPFHVQPVDNQGKFTEEVSDFKGEYVFDSNKKIIEFSLKKSL